MHERLVVPVAAHDDRRVTHQRARSRRGRPRGNRCLAGSADSDVAEAQRRNRRRMHGAAVVPSSAVRACARQSRRANSPARARRAPRDRPTPSPYQTLVHEAHRSPSTASSISLQSWRLLRRLARRRRLDERQLTVVHVDAGKRLRNEELVPALRVATRATPCARTGWM